jgi:hypothetical protein
MAQFVGIRLRTDTRRLVERLLFVALAVVGVLEYMGITHVLAAFSL